MDWVQKRFPNGKTSEYWDLVREKAEELQQEQEVHFRIRHDLVLDKSRFTKGIFSDEVRGKGETDG